MVVPGRAATFIGITLCVLAGLPGSASANWDQVKKFLQKDVEIVSESEDKLVIYHSGAGQKITLANGSDKSAGADITGVLKRRRGGNPYRVWCASEPFWNDPLRPKSKWGMYFRMEFLSILRPPKEAV